MSNRLYNYRWRKARRAYLDENPLCVMCIEDGRTSLATELDHIKKHDNNLELFWDVQNWQGLCAFHHRSVKSRMERSGKIIGNKADGTPIDPGHHWKN